MLQHIYRELLTHCFRQRQHQGTQDAIQDIHRVIGINEAVVQRHRRPKLPHLRLHLETNRIDCNLILTTTTATIHVYLINTSIGINGDHLTSLLACEQAATTFGVAFGGYHSGTIHAPHIVGEICQPPRKSFCTTLTSRISATIPNGINSLPRCATMPP